MRLPLASLALLTAVLAGCSDAGDEPSGPGVQSASTSNTAAEAGGAMAPMQAEVMAMNNQFTPAEVTVKVGGTVRWVDHDSANPHNVVSTSEGNAFRSPDMDAALPTHAKEYSHTFQAAGTVDYLCEYHPGMVGTVLVVE